MLPDPTALPRHESRVTRSRKGRASFIVTRRSDFRDGATRGDVDYVDPQLDVLASVAGDTSERALVMAADALLSRSVSEAEFDSLRLIGRVVTRQKVWGSRRDRGILHVSHAVMPDDPDRADYWCDHHEAGAERCECAISRRVSPGPLLNGGTDNDHAGESVPWAQRFTITRRGRLCPICGNRRADECSDECEPTTATPTVIYSDGNGAAYRSAEWSPSPYAVIPAERSATVHDDGRIVSVVTWADGGCFIGHRWESYRMAADRRRTEKTRRSSEAVAAERDSVQAAAAAAADRRRSMLDDLLALRPGSEPWSPREGIVVKRARRGYCVTTADAETNHGTPAAALMRVDELMTA